MGFARSPRGLADTVARLVPLTKLPLGRHRQRENGQRSGVV